MKQTGWDHPAWREAYSLAQLCLAASYTFPGPTRTAPAPPANSDRAASGTASPSLVPHVTLPSQSPFNGALQPSPPALAHQRPSEDAQPDSLPASTVPDRQGSMQPGSSKCGSFKKDTPQQGSPRKGTSRQGSPRRDSPKQGSTILKAMQALDLAAIMGAPNEMLEPILNMTEPLAKQAHQASLAQQNSPSLQSAQQSSSRCQADAVSQQQGGSVEHSRQAASQQTGCQAKLAAEGPLGWCLEGTWHV